jgi:hypothetical protein
LDDVDPVDAARRRHHLGRPVDADHVGARPASGEGRGQRAGAAAEVDDLGRVFGRHPRDQVAEWPGAFVAEGEIALRIPHLRLLTTDQPRKTIARALS